MELFLGHNIKKRQLTKTPFYLNNTDLLTHGFICGSTGSGKTVLAKIIIEEMARQKIPSILIDLKGDISSFAVPLKKFSTEEIEPWVDSIKGPERFKKAREISKKYSKELSESNIEAGTVEKFRNNVDISIFTPKSQKGKKVSISLMVSAPDDLHHYMEKDEATILNMIETYASGIIVRVYLDDNVNDHIIEKGFIEEIIKYLWLNNILCDGISGIKKLIQMVIKPPFETIGVMKVDSFISKVQRFELARRLNTLIIGAEKLWYDGETIDSIIKNAVEKNNDKTKITIFNLSVLDDFEDKSLIVSQIAYSIYNWMRKNVNSFDPQLLFFIDEIGGSGNKAFFPADPYYSTSKPAINFLIRQGRAFGICTLLATQNPGDIDYKGLTNCQTWFIGKLLTAEDRQKILQGIASHTYMLQQIDEFIKTADSGEFIIKTKNGSINTFKERWLLSFHKIITPDEIEEIDSKIYSNYFLENFEKYIKNNKYEKVEEFIEKELSKDDEMYYFYFAKLNYNFKNYLKAFEYIENAILKNNNNFSFWELKAIISLEMKNYFVAEDSLEKAVQLNSTNENIFILKGKVKLKAKKYNEAEQCFNNAVEISPRNSEAWYSKAEFEYQLKKYDQAFESIKEAIKFSENYNYYYSVLAGNILIKNYEYMNAMDHFRTAMKEFPEKCEAYIGSGICQTMLKDNNSAKLFFDKSIEINDNKFEPYFYLGIIYKNEDDLSLSEEYFKRAIKIKPDNIDVYIELVDVLKMTLRIDEAIEFMKKAESISKDTKILLNLADLYFIKKDMKNSYNYFISVLENIPEDEHANLKIAEIYLEQKDIPKAIDKYKKVIDINPHNLSALEFLSKWLFKNKKYEESMDYLKKYIEVDKENEDIWFKTAYIYHEWKKYVRALSCYKRVIGINKENIQAFLNCGKIQIELGKYDEAHDYFDNVEKIDNKNSQVWKERAELYKILGESEKMNFCYEKADQLLSKT